jgi:extracellular factor (EF) 3-hydroxypalmitic acid methyl ester biosynthesis protein
LEAEGLRTRTRNAAVRILSVGCGPAIELQQFIVESPLADRAEATLVDFNEETLEFARGALEQATRKSGRQCTVTLQKKSVLQLLKEAAKVIADDSARKFDFIYCAGLFDYLPDRTCKQLNGVFFNNLAPGGLIVVTNVDDRKPFRHMLEFLLDWHLVYRDRNALLELAPAQVPAEQCSINQDATGTNLFLEVRRPEVRT